MNDIDDDYRNRSRLKQSEEAGSLKKPLIISAIIHGVVILFLIIGMPHISTRDFDAPPPVMVELAPISEMAQTNRAPVKAEKKPEEKKKEEPPKPQQEKVKKAPKKEEPAPKPVEKKPTPPKPEEKKPEKKEALSEKPAEDKPKKPEEKKPEKKEEPKKEEDSEAALDSLLQDLTPTESTYEAPETDVTTENTSPTPTPDAPLGATLSMTELDALRYQLSQCWNIPAGAQGAEDLNVEVKIVVNPDRTAQSVTIVDMARYNSDSFFRAAADSARRAVLNPNCSPLKLPADKYDQWHVTYVNFNPKDMF